MRKGRRSDAAARPGPRPLLGQLTAAGLSSLASLAALPLARSGSLPWNPALQAKAAALAPELRAADPASLAEAVVRALAGQQAAMLQGIAGYRAHPYRRRLPDPPCLWRDGPARLLDYGGSGPAILFVPSLVNRAYVLDLSARRSLLRHLARTGFRPLLLDWGAPDEPDLGLGELIAGRLTAALEQAVAAAGGPVALAGYCMGGTLATALAARRPADVRALVLLAAPWDFHAEGAARAGLCAAIGRSLADAAPGGFLPVDWLQLLFAAGDPDLLARKYAAFAGLDPASPAAADFVALEDWANDGVPLARAVAAECFGAWYGENRPAAGTWRIRGRPVRPARIKCPALVVVPREDRIVPPASALALLRQLPAASLLRPAAAHVKMVVGDTAPQQLWEPMIAWLRAHLCASGTVRRHRLLLREGAPLS